MTKTALSFGPIAIRLVLALAVAAPVAGVAEAAPKKNGPAEPAVGAQAASADLDPCATRYGESLKRLGEAELPRLRAAVSSEAGASADAPAVVVPAAADPVLPGRPLFVSPSRPRSPAEISALTAAVALARSRGVSTTVAGGSQADRQWVAARLQEELGDYLRQKPTPYLCRGVGAYLETLRKAAGRLGPASDQRAAWIATVRASAERSIKGAEVAIATTKPALAKADAAQAELRPAAGNARSETPVGPRLDGEAAILAAIDELVARTRAAGLVSEPPAPTTTGSAAAPAVVSPRPVLARLAALKPLVSSSRPLVREQPVRLKLLSAFADFEMLDYLMKASDQPADPVASAIGTVFGGIEAAQRAECTCAN